MTAMTRRRLFGLLRPRDWAYQDIQCWGAVADGIVSRCDCVHEQRCFHYKHIQYE